jgi:serine/threonine protein kinase
MVSSNGLGMRAPPETPRREEKQTLLERQSEAEGRARSMAAVIELRHISMPRSKSDSLRARRNRVSVENFELLKVIGRGAFGEVRLCREKATQRVLAMKTMRKRALVEQGKVAHVWAERVAMSEAADGNPWLVQLHHAWCSAEHVYLVMDYLPGGDLMSLLMRRDTLPEDEARFYAAEALLAIASLHALGFAHRDVKPDNLLLDASGHLRLADLGLAKSVAPHATDSQQPAVCAQPSPPTFPPATSAGTTRRKIRWDAEAAHDPAVALSFGPMPCQWDGAAEVAASGAPPALSGTRCAGSCGSGSGA